jgi:hypothetical protein
MFLIEREWIEFVWEALKPNELIVLIDMLRRFLPLFYLDGRGSLRLLR